MAKEVVVVLGGDWERYRKNFSPTSGEKLENYGLYYGIYRGIIREYKKEEGVITIEIPSLNLLLSYSVYYFYDFAFPFASGEAGVYFDPQVGDAVFIAFENGSLNYPIILGYFQPLGKHREIFDAGDNGRRVLHFKTRSGHEFNITDEQGKETIELINSKQNVKITIKDNQITFLVGNETEIFVSNGETYIKSPQIKLYKDKNGKIQPMVLGNELVDFLKQLLNVLIVHNHAPNSPPNQVSDFTQLKAQLDKLLSKINQLE